VAALTTDLPVPAPPTSQNRRFSSLDNDADDAAEDATEEKEDEEEDGESPSPLPPSLTHWRISSNSHSLLP